MHAHDACNLSTRFMEFTEKRKAGNIFTHRMRAWTILSAARLKLAARYSTQISRLVVLRSHVYRVILAANLGELLMCIRLYSFARVYPVGLKMWVKMCREIACSSTAGNNVTPNGFHLHFVTRPHFQFERAHAPPKSQQNYEHNWTQIDARRKC